MTGKTSVEEALERIKLEGLSPIGATIALEGGGVTPIKAQALEEKISKEQTSKTSYNTIQDAIREILTYINPDDDEVNNSEKIFIYAQQTVNLYKESRKKREYYSDLYKYNNELIPSILRNNIESAHKDIGILENKIELHDKIGEERICDQLADLEYDNIQHICTLTYYLTQQIASIDQYIKEHLK